MELVTDPFGEQIPPLGVSTGAHPEEKSNFRRKTQTFDKLGQKEGEALVVVGDRQALDDVINGVAERHRKERETLQE
jgi:hypothetical protein